MTVTTHPHPLGYSYQQIQYKNIMRVDQNDQVWIGYRDIGIGRYDGSGWTMYDSVFQGLASNNVLDIDFAANGDVWAGTTYGGTHFNGTSWTNFNTVNSGMPQNKVTAVSCGASQVWFGTEAGIASFDGAFWQIYNTANSGLLNDTVLSILATPWGAVYIGTRRGLSKFENNSWTTYDSLTSEIPSTQIYDLEYDNYGNTWIAGTWVFAINSSGQVLNFQGDLYQDEFPITTSRIDFAKDNFGRILFKVTTGINYYFRFNNLQYDLFQIPAFNQGTQVLGYCIEMDSNNQLWFNSRREAGTSSLVSMDLNSYQPVPLPLLGTSFDNYKHLEINDVKTLMMNRGDMHWDLNNAKYEVPKGSGKNTVYASAFWIGGLDATGELHLAAQTYRQTGMDYWPGPISGMSLPFDSTTCEHYNKIWKISKWEVEAFKNNFANGSITNGTAEVPKFFLSWPAKGNNFITDDKAPFFDNNTDTIYNPFDGDYPLIKGDQMLFWIFNDSLTVHSATTGSSLGVEILASAYAYNCPGIADSNAVLNTTTLYNFRILNRSQADYNSVYMGLWSDTNLGNGLDDYIGCDSSIAAGFTYNSDNDDYDGWGRGYGLNPPMQNVVVLKGALADVGDGLDNDLDNIVDEPGERTTMNHFHTYYGIGIYENPYSDQDHYNYMRSLWLNGTPATYGGWASGGTTPTNFIFSGTPYDTGWTEINELNPGEDRRFLLSSGPVSLPAGGEITLDFAYVFTRDSLNPNGLTTSVARNIADVQRVHSWFNNDNFPSCEQYVTGDNTVAESLMPEVLVNPNPVTDILYIHQNITESGNYNFIVTDVAGRLVKSGSVIDQQIDVKSLNKGVYLLNLFIGHDRHFVKFVKME